MSDFFGHFGIAFNALSDNGVSTADERDLNDATLHARLWELINNSAFQLL